MNTKKLIEIAALWKKQDRNGNPYLSGKISPKEAVKIEPGMSIQIYPNNYKEKESQPDYRVMLVPAGTFPSGTPANFNDGDSAL